jgi:peptidyl-prolyl cis-trans isomerase B (cyclophilin B)
VASKRDRQRRLERARTERRIARQAASQRRRRQIQAAVGAGLALLLIVFGTIWLLGGFESKPAPTENVAAGTCTWHLVDPDPANNVFDTGHPPTTGEKRTGTEKMSIKTSLGDIEAELDLAKAPCTAASFGFLAGKKYFDGGKCHRVNTDTLFVVQCGDPSGTGQGRPSYRFANENVPVEPTPTASVSPSTSQPPTNLYPKGTIAMANSGVDTNGSQFFIVYAEGAQLGPEYTIAGKVTKGLDILQKVAKGGAVNSEGKDVKDGTPKTELIIQTLTVGDAPPTPTPTG